MGINEVGYDDKGNGIIYVDPKYFRPAEVSSLLGDASKARTKLGWQPKVMFEDLVREMVDADLAAEQKANPL